MNDLDKNQFKTLMIGMGETYNKEVTKPLLQIYFKSLEGFSIEDVSNAFSAHLIDTEHGTFFPKPADIVRLIGSNKPSIEEKASLAWMTIIGEVRRTGAYGSLDIEDKIALAALKNIGGWNKLCMSNESDLPWIEKSFVAAYSTFEKTPLEMLPKSLPGIVEIEERKIKSAKSLQNITDKLSEIRALKDE